MHRKSIDDGGEAVIPDFLDLSGAPDHRNLFECSTSDRIGEARIAISGSSIDVTELGESIRISAADVLEWRASADDPCFVLTISSAAPHRVRLPSRFRGGVVAAMTRTFGSASV